MNRMAQVTQFLSKTGSAKEEVCGCAGVTMQEQWAERKEAWDALGGQRGGSYGDEPCVTGHHQ